MAAQSATPLLKVEEMCIRDRLWAFGAGALCVIGRASFFFILRVGRASVNRAEKAGFCVRRLYNPAKRRYALPIDVYKRQA